MEFSILKYIFIHLKTKFLFQIEYISIKIYKKYLIKKSQKKQIKVRNNT